MFVYNTDYAALCETWKEFGNIIFIFTKAKSANCMEIKQKKYKFLDAKCLFGKCLSKVFFFFLLGNMACNNACNKDQTNFLLQFVILWFLCSNWL